MLTPFAKPPSAGRPKPYYNCCAKTPTTSFGNSAQWYFQFALASCSIGHVAWFLYMVASCEPLILFKLRLLLMQLLAGIRCLNFTPKLSEWFFASTSLCNIVCHFFSGLELFIWRDLLPPLSSSSTVFLDQPCWRVCGFATRTRAVQDRCRRSSHESAITELFLATSCTFCSVKEFSIT